MNKAEFIDLVQEKGSYKTKIEAEEAIKAFTAAVECSMLKGDGVSIVGFGAFSRNLQKGKTGKVPGTDKTYTTQDKMVPKFKAAKGLKDSIAKGI